MGFSAGARRKDTGCRKSLFPDFLVGGVVGRFLCVSTLMLCMPKSSGQNFWVRLDDLRVPSGLEILSIKWLIS